MPKKTKKTKKTKKSETRNILVINAGLDGVWEPSKKELKKLTKLFAKALEDTNVSSVVAVRDGVKVSLLGVE